MKRLLRILTSPIVFGVTTGALLLFPGTIALFMGVPILIYKWLGNKRIDRDDIGITFCIFWYPGYVCYRWIKDGEIPG